MMCRLKKTIVAIPIFAKPSLFRECLLPFNPFMSIFRRCSSSRPLTALGSEGWSIQSWRSPKAVAIGCTHPTCSGVVEGCQLPPPGPSPGRRCLEEWFICQSSSNPRPGSPHCRFGSGRVSKMISQVPVGRPRSAHRPRSSASSVSEGRRRAADTRRRSKTMTACSPPLLPPSSLRRFPLTPLGHRHPAEIRRTLRLYLT